MHIAHPRRTPRQAIGPTLIALVAVFASGALDPGGPSAAAGTSGRNGAFQIPPGVVLPQQSALATIAATEPRARVYAPVIVETRSGEALPARPRVDVPVSDAIALPRLARGSKVVVLGDSFTSGWNGAGIGAAGWPAIVSRARGWSMVNLAVAGTGFMNPGWTGQTIGSRVATAVRSRPDIVFIVGGHNDSRWSAASVNTAADRVIDRLRSALPDAVLVIVGPIWQSGSPPARCRVLRDHLGRKAAAVGAVFVDPLAEGWFAGSSHRLIGADGLHPTNAGHRFIADRILANLAGT